MTGVVIAVLSGILSHDVSPPYLTPGPPSYELMDYNPVASVSVTAIKREPCVWSCANKHGMTLVGHRGGHSRLSEVGNEPVFIGAIPLTELRVRFTVLTSRMIRMEYSSTKTFEVRAAA